MIQLTHAAFAAVAALAVAGAAFAVFPAHAEEDTSFVIDLTLDETLPRVAGTVFVTYANGTGVDVASVSVVSTIDLAPQVPGASSTGATRADGTFPFAFGHASTGSVPGDHTITVTVSHGGVDQTATFHYSVPEL